MLLSTTGMCYCFTSLNDHSDRVTSLRIVEGQVVCLAASCLSKLMCSGVGASGQFATADAARVGGGLYGHLLEALCTLATDPAPNVAKLGKTVLRLAGVEITHVHPFTGIHLTYHKASSR